MLAIKSRFPFVFLFVRNKMFIIKKKSMNAVHRYTAQHTRAWSVALLAQMPFTVSYIDFWAKILSCFSGSKVPINIGGLAVNLNCQDQMLYRLSNEEFFL